MNIRYKKTFATGWSGLEKRLLPSYVWTSDPLTFWRERILFLICFIVAVLGPIALVPSLLLAYKEGLWSIILIDSLAYMTIVMILIARNSSFVVRALELCSILYALGIWILFILGPVGAGYIWLFGASVLISTFIGLGAAIWALAVNAIALLSVGIFIAYGNPAWILHVDNALEKWMVMSANFLLINALITITTAFLLNGLRTALLIEQKISKSLLESESYLRVVLESTADAILAVDHREKVLWKNALFSELWRIPKKILHTDEDQLFLDHMLTMVADPDAFLKKAQELYASEKVSFDSLDLKDGRIFERFSCALMSEGKNIGRLWSFRDITERKQAEEEKAKLEAQLRHAQKMEGIGTLAGGIAHDFNNILNVIMGYGAMVMDTLAADSQSKNDMHEVLIAADRAAILTKRLLTFSRKQPVEVKLININELIVGLHKMLLRMIRESIDFHLDLADMPLIVLADAGQLEQVLINLVVNAKDAMRDGGRLTIGTALEEIDEAYVAAYGYGKPGRYALITVADTGQGMDAETQKKIFEPFFTTKGVGDGTGLGLAISYGIIKQHSGYIEVYSESGEGAVFKMYLPLSEEAASLDKKMEDTTPVKGGHETVLVAEDDASMRKLSRIVLESFGYTVIEAEDGDDAIAKFMENRERISIVLLDMIMPKKNGKEVSAMIRKVCPNMKILFASGYTMEIVTNKELIEGGFDFIRKPFQSKDLLAKVREILDR